MKTQEIVMMESDMAATPCTIAGWKSRNGQVFCEERVARYDGCTHRKCEKCGQPVEKEWLVCNPCRQLDSIGKWKAMPRKQWDGKSMLYSEANDTYYTDIDDVLGDMVDGQAVDDLRLVICEPEYAYELSTEYWCDQLPTEEHESPAWLEELVNEFNKKLEGQEPLSWSPGKFALDSSNL